MAGYDKAITQSINLSLIDILRWQMNAKVNRFVDNLVVLHKYTTTTVFQFPLQISCNNDIHHNQRYRSFFGGGLGNPQQSLVNVLRQSKFVTVSWLLG